MENENRSTLKSIGIGLLILAAFAIAIMAASGRIDLSGISGLLSNTSGGNNTSIFDEDNTGNSGTTNNGSNNSSSPLYASCVGKGIYVEVVWNKFRTGDHYLIPRSELTTMAADTFLMFEGEQAKKGLHEVLPVVAANGEFAPQVSNDGLSLYQGSFWRYATNDEGCVPVNDLLMVFASDKRDNWTSQGMRGNPIKVWVSTGAVEFLPGEDVTLSDAQDELAINNADQRCPTGNVAYEENPLGNPESTELVVSQIGSSSCKTLLVRGETARYFTGARDGVSYRPAETRVFLVPVSWGEDEMRYFLEGQGISFNSLEALQ
jgi:hypothetical protein